MLAHACHRGCTIKCSRIYLDENGQYLTKGPEYETVWAHGANCGIDDLDAIAHMDRMDDDLGLDTIETGATIAVAMEAGVIPFGDAAGSHRTAGGSPRRARRWDDWSRPVRRCWARPTACARIPTVKGQSMPAYDPRAIKGIGVTYATTTQGADHTAGYAITANVLGVGGHVDPLSPEGQVELSRNLQIATAAIDAVGLCLFVAFAVLDDPQAAGGTLRAARRLHRADRSRRRPDADGAKTCWSANAISTREPASPPPMIACPTSSRPKNSPRTMRPSTSRTKNSTRFQFRLIVEPATLFAVNRFLGTAHIAASRRERVDHQVSIAYLV